MAAKDRAVVCSAVVISDLKPYPAMKGSGVAWLGVVPKHWAVLPNRALFAEVKERDRPDADMLSVTIRRGVIRQEALLEDSSKKDSSNLDRSAYKLVRPGDIAYNRMRAWQGAVGVSEYEGIVSPAYVVQRPREGAEPRYLHYLLRTPAFAKEAERWSYGITSDMWSLRPEHFRMIYSCLPPLPEQSAIVRFLDHADRRIRRYIRAKQKLIKLLEEQKQAIIHRAVTRGLDPNVRLKPSGMEWLGHVPEHWVLYRAKLILRQVVTPIPANAEMVTCFRDGQVTLRRNRRTEGFTNAIKELGYQGIKVGQLVLHSMDAFAGAIGVSDSEGKCSPEYVICEPLSADTFVKYYALLLRSLALRGLFVVLCPSVRERAPRVRYSDFGEFCLPKPCLREQQQIVAAIEAGCSEIERNLRLTRRAVDLVEQYRIRLIADVVTGKLDVREAAARLQAESEEPEPLDEIEGEADIDEAGADDSDEVPEEMEP